MNRQQKGVETNDSYKNNMNRSYLRSKAQILLENQYESLQFLPPPVLRQGRRIWPGKNRKTRYGSRYESRI